MSDYAMKQWHELTAECDKLKSQLRAADELAKAAEKSWGSTHPFEGEPIDFADPDFMFDLWKALVAYEKARDEK